MLYLQVKQARVTVEIVRPLCVRIPRRPCYLVIANSSVSSLEQFGVGKGYYLFLGIDSVGIDLRELTDFQVLLTDFGISSNSTV